MNKTFVAGPFFTIRMYIPKLSKFDSDTIGYGPIWAKLPMMIACHPDTLNSHGLGTTEARESA